MAGFIIVLPPLRNWCILKCMDQSYKRWSVISSFLTVNWLQKWQQKLWSLNCNSLLISKKSFMCWKYPIILHFIRTSPMEVCSKYCMDFWRNRRWCSHCLSCVLHVMSSFVTKQFWLNIAWQSSATSCLILCYVWLLGTTSFFMSVSSLTGIFIYIFFMSRELVSYFICRTFEAPIRQIMSLIWKELESQ